MLDRVPLSTHRYRRTFDDRARRCGERAGRHGHARSLDYFVPFLRFVWARSLAATIFSDFDEDVLDSSLLAVDAAFLPVANLITSLLRREIPATEPC